MSLIIRLVLTSAKDEFPTWSFFRTTLAVLDSFPDHLYHGVPPNLMGFSLESKCIVLVRNDVFIIPRFLPMNMECLGLAVYLALPKCLSSKHCVKVQNQISLGLDCSNGSMFFLTQVRASACIWLVCIFLLTFLFYLLIYIPAHTHTYLYMFCHPRKCLLAY